MITGVAMLVMGNVLVWVLYLLLRTLHREHRHQWSAWSAWIPDYVGTQTVRAVRVRTCDCGLTAEQQSVRHRCLTPQDCPHIAVLNETTTERMEREMGM